MRECPWCGRMNLNVYGYCQSCGRGFDGPENPDARFADGKAKTSRGLWPFSRSKSEAK
jgi:hypothetical protein